MKLRILTGVAAAALTMTGCADADNDAAAGETMADEEMADAGATTDPAAEEMMDATDPLAGDPDAQGDDGTLGSDRTMQGQWFADELAGMDAALYGPPESEAAFSVRCDSANNELVFARSVMQPEGEVDMRLMAGGETRTITADSTPDPMPSVSGRLAAGDSFAAVLADVSQPFAVAIGEGASFRMPASATFRAVISGCRS